MFYAEATARVIFTAKTSLDGFSLRRDHVWTGSVLGECICEMKRMRESGRPERCGGVEHGVALLAEGSTHLSMHMAVLNYQISICKRNNMLDKHT